MPKVKKPKMPPKLDPAGREYQRLKIQVALGYCPGIYPCAHCGGPVIRGYCCDRCGTSDPQGLDLR